MDASCPLCVKLSALDSLPPGDVVWQFPHSIAFLGPWQYHTGYCVLVARTHARELFEMRVEECRGYFEEMLLLARAIGACFSPRKINYEMLGNQVAHPHWHLFPRRADDPETLKAAWVALDRADKDPAEHARLTGTTPRGDITRQLQAYLRSHT